MLYSAGGGNPDNLGITQAELGDAEAQKNTPFREISSFKDQDILDFSITWKAANGDEKEFIGRDRSTGALKFYGTRADLIFGSNTELRAICEVYGADDGERIFISDFIDAWAKVMDLDRFDLK